MQHVRTQASVVLFAALAAGAPANGQAGRFFTELNYVSTSAGSNVGAVSSDGRFAAGSQGTSAHPFGELVRWYDPTPGGVPAHALGEPVQGGNGMEGVVGISDDGASIACNAIYNHPILGIVPIPTRWSDPSAGGNGFVALGFLPGPHPYNFGYARAMSADGTIIVGESTNIDPNVGVQGKAFRWELTNPATGAGVLTELEIFPRDITPDGRVIVGSGAFATPGGAARWENGTMVNLGVLPGDTGSSAYAVADDGNTIAGISWNANGSRVFRWTKGGGMTELPWPTELTSFRIIRDISGDGKVVIGEGSFANGNGREGIVWDLNYEPMSIKQYLQSVHRMRISWTRLLSFAISSDGRTIVGGGFGPVNARQTWLAYLGEAPCYADCDQSTGNGVLDIFDFLCFQGSFVSGEPYACDCDTSTGPLVCDLFDFLCFQNAFVAGCP